MRFRTSIFIALLFAVLFAASFSTAQLGALNQPAEQIITPSALCASLVTQAESAVGPLCSNLGRNQACYGNKTVEVDFRPNANVVFNTAGAVVNLSTIQSLTTAPLNPQTNDWGIAILKAQANLPDALPGQNVTFILYGDTTIDNPSPDMKAVTVNTRFGNPQCVGAPNSALLIQSPQGSQTTMNINGVDMTLGSTAFITAVQNQDMAVAIVEGTGVINAMGTTRVITPGGQVRIPLGGTDGLHVSGQPSELEPFDYDALISAPLSLLERPVTVPPPIGNLFATPLPSATTVACTPRADWTFTYVVPFGDTLSGIAARIGISTASLAAGNCITNPNLLTAGQTIRAPKAVPVFVLHTLTPSHTPTQTFTPTITPTPSNTPTPQPPTANLSAQDGSIPPVTCTTLNWTTTNATTASINSSSVALNGSMDVCPTETTTYTLTANGAGGTANSSVTVTVLPVCNNDGICQPYENSDTCDADCGNGGGG